jgi:hypothetical protein
MPRIFISYSRADAPFAHRLTASLREAGGDVWIDVADIRSGDDWSDAIQQALDDCAVMLLVLSPEAMDSVNVASEWKYYLDEGKTVIPVLLREARINFRLRPLNYIDFFRQDYETALAQLRAELERHDVTFAQPGLDPVGAPLPADEGGRSFRTLALGVAIAVLALAAVILSASTLIDFGGDGKKSGEPSAEELAQTLVARRDATQTAAALVLEPVATPDANPDNLLRNPGFEGPFDALSRDGQTLHLADGWIPWYVLTDESGSDVYPTPDYAAASSDNALSGSAAQSFGANGAGFDGGVHQQVTVTTGTLVNFTAYVKQESTTSTSARVSVGIDPAGGTDATSGDIVWSVPDTLAGEYHALSVQATAHGGQVTVFVRGKTDAANAGTVSVYVDDASLTALGGS